MEVKTIDVQGFSNTHGGNPYYAGYVCINFGMPDEKYYYMPYQWGTRDCYLDTAARLLCHAEILPLKKYEMGGVQPLWDYCREHGIILRKNVQPAPLHKLKEYTELANLHHPQITGIW